MGLFPPLHHRPHSPQPRCRFRVGGGANGGATMGESAAASAAQPVPLGHMPTGAPRGMAAVEIEPIVPYYRVPTRLHLGVTLAALFAVITISAMTYGFIMANQMLSATIEEYAAEAEAADALLASFDPRALRRELEGWRDDALLKYACVLLPTAAPTTAPTSLAAQVVGVPEDDGSDGDGNDDASAAAAAAPTAAPTAVCEQLITGYASELIASLNITRMVGEMLDASLDSVFEPFNLTALLHGALKGGATAGLLDDGGGGDDSAGWQWNVTNSTTNSSASSSSFSSSFSIFDRELASVCVPLTGVDDDGLTHDLLVELGLVEDEDDDATPSPPPTMTSDLTLATSNAAPSAAPYSCVDDDAAAEATYGAGLNCSSLTHVEAGDLCANAALGASVRALCALSCGACPPSHAPTTTGAPTPAPTTRDDSSPAPTPFSRYVSSLAPSSATRSGDNDDVAEVCVEVTLDDLLDTALSAYNTTLSSVLGDVSELVDELDAQYNSAIGGVSLRVLLGDELDALEDAVADAVTLASLADRAGGNLEATVVAALRESVASIAAKAVDTAVDIFLNGTLYESAYDTVEAYSDYAHDTFALARRYSQVLGNAIFIAMLVAFFAIVWALCATRTNYRRATLQMRASGGFNELHLTRIGKGRSVIFQASSGLAFVGMLAANAVFCSVLTMLLCIGLAFVALLPEAWAYVFSLSMFSFSRLRLSLIVWVVGVLVDQMFVNLFISDNTYVTHRACVDLFDFLLTLWKIINCPVTVLMRVGFVSAAMVFNVLRIDVPIIRGRLALADPGYNAFVSLVMMHERQNNPVLQASSRLLLGAYAETYGRRDRQMHAHEFDLVQATSRVLAFAHDGHFDLSGTPPWLRPLAPPPLIMPRPTPAPPTSATSSSADDDAEMASAGSLRVLREGGPDDDDDGGGSGVWCNGATARVGTPAAKLHETVRVHSLPSGAATRDDHDRGEGGHASAAQAEAHAAARAVEAYESAAHDRFRRAVVLAWRRLVYVFVLAANPSLCPWNAEMQRQHPIGPRLRARLLREVITLHCAPAFSRRAPCGASWCALF